jgi:hypothetical protein
VTETGLLIAEAAFLVLLYLFIWSIVRSSNRDLRNADSLVAAPPPVTEPARSGDTGANAVIERRADAAGDASAPEPVAPAPVSRSDDTGSRERVTGPALDLSMNIRPRLVVAASPSLAPDVEYSLEAGLTIGRSRSSGIPLSDQFASHMHARVFPSGQFMYIEDLGSTNGTFVNGRRLEGQTQLRVRDEIRIGETVLRYEE